MRRSDRRSKRLVIESLEPRCVLTTGDIDLSFGNSGIAKTDFQNLPISGNLSLAAALQSDLKIVAIGEGAIARYHTDGTLDTSFDTDGIVAIPFLARDVAVQSDGKIVVAGDANGTSQMTVARFLSNGQLDTTFDGDGIATIMLGPNGGSTSSLVIQQDGKIVVAGSGDVGGRFGLAAVRLQGDGSLDATFGVQGRAVYGFNEIDAAFDVTLQSDGRIVLVGRTGRNTGGNFQFDALVVRLLPNGRLDNSFDGDGWVSQRLSPADRATGVATQADGSIFVSGATRTSSSDTGAFVFKLTRSGSLDTSFDTDGIQIETFGLFAPKSEDLLVDSDGRVLLVGSVSSRIAIVRYNADGSRDPSFGIDGKVTLANAVGRAVIPQANGSFIVAGANRGFFGLARFLSNGLLDNSFNSDGLVQTEFGPTVDVVGEIAIQPDGKTVAVGQTGRETFLARYRTDGKLDTAFARGGKVITRFSDLFQSTRANSVALQSDGKIVIAGLAVTVTGDTADGDLLVARFLPNGTLDTSFSGDGWLTTDLLGYESASSVLIQPDGKIVVGGSDNGGFTFARYNTNGTLDQSFNRTGVRSIPIGSGFSSVNKVMLQSDGAIVGVGHIFVATSSGPPSGTLVVVRLLPDGRNDRSFNLTGILIGRGTNQKFGHDAALQSDGTILIAGGTSRAPRNTVANLSVLKLLPSGAHDPSFGVDGLSEVVLATNSLGKSISIQPNGKIVVGGQNGSSFVVVRLNSDGSPDSSFAGDGIATTPRVDFPVISADVAILADGRVVLAGAEQDFSSGRLRSSVNLIRYRSDAVPVDALLVTRNASGAIEVRDQWSRDDQIEISRSGNSIVLTEKSLDTRAKFKVLGLAGISGNGTKQITIPLGLIQNANQPLLLNLLRGDDRVMLNTAGLSPDIIPTTGLKFNFGLGNDELNLVGTTTDNLWSFSGAFGGNVSLGNLGIATFTNLENAIGGSGVDDFRFAQRYGLASTNINGGTGLDRFEVVRDADMTLSSTSLFGISAALEVKSAIVQRYSITAIESVSLVGGSSRNVIDARTYTLGVSIDGRGGDDVLYGGDNDDVIRGGPGNDLISGQGGADTLFGDAGNDVIMGGFGPDLIYGGTGQDLITGANFASLVQRNTGSRDAILAAWFSSETYAQRVNRLTVIGVGANNSIKLIPDAEAFGDFNVDTIFGGGDSDWFFLAISGTLSELGVAVGGLRDLQSGELVTALV